MSEPLTPTCGTEGPPVASSSDAITPVTHSLLIPGNGCGSGSLAGCMWYPWLVDQLAQIGGITTAPLRGFPDHLRAREHIWKAFAREGLGLCPGSLVIGHSSGAACALRLMEDGPFAACLLVAAYNTDLGDDLERGSGYFSRPFDYDAMVCNVPVIVQCHSADDHLVPVAVARDVAANLRRASERFNTANPDKRPHVFVYVETSDDGHFQEDVIDVLWTTLRDNLPL